MSNNYRDSNGEEDGIGLKCAHIYIYIYIGAIM